MSTFDPESDWFIKMVNSFETNTTTQVGSSNNHTQYRDFGDFYFSNKTGKINHYNYPPENNTMSNIYPIEKNLFNI